MNDADMLELLTIPVVRQQIVKQLNKSSSNKKVIRYYSLDDMIIDVLKIDADFEDELAWCISTYENNSILVQIYRKNLVYSIFDPSGSTKSMNVLSRTLNVMSNLFPDHRRNDTGIPQIKSQENTFLTVMSHYTGIDWDEIARHLIGLITLVRSDQYVVNDESNGIVSADKETPGARQGTCLLLNGKFKVQCRDLQDQKEVISSAVLDDVLNSGFYRSEQLQDLIIKAYGRNEIARACIWSNSIGYNRVDGSFYTLLEASKQSVDASWTTMPFDTSLFKYWFYQCDKRMVGVSVSILYGGNKGHKNMLVIDRKNKCIEHYEPNISDDPVTKALETLMKIIIPEYTYIRPQIITDMPHGIQGIQRQKEKLLPGACGMWCLWYLHFRIHNPDEEPNKSFERAIKTPENLDQMIRDFASEMLSLLNMTKVSTKITEIGKGKIIRSGEELGHCIHVPNTNYYIRCTKLPKEKNSIDQEMSQNIKVSQVVTSFVNAVVTTLLTSKQ